MDTKDVGTLLYQRRERSGGYTKLNRTRRKIEATGIDYAGTDGPYMKFGSVNCAGMTVLHLLIW